MSDYYRGEAGKAYFHLRHKRRSPLAQAESSIIFRKYAELHMTVVDFGCGTGGILDHLPCKAKFGVEVNEDSAAEARNRGINVVNRVVDLPRGEADLIISHHALEHVNNPFQVLRELQVALKANGRIVLVVPAENIRRSQFRRWHEDGNFHLYSWNPLTLGNLLVAAGFQQPEGRVIASGYSHYIEPIRPLKPLFRLAKYAVALAFSRYSTFCTAIK